MRYLPINVEFSMYRTVEEINAFTTEVGVLGRKPGVEVEAFLLKMELLE